MKVKRKLIILGSLFLILLSLPEIAYCQGDSTLFKRITWNAERGVFLTKKGEELTIDAVLAAEEYKGNYVAQYWINEEQKYQLKLAGDRIYDLENKLISCESNILKSTDNMVLFKTLHEESKAENSRLKAENKGLKVKLPLYKFGTIAFGVSTVTFGTLYLLQKL